MELQSRDLETAFEQTASERGLGFVSWLRGLERRFMEEEESDYYTDYREELVRCWPTEPNKWRDIY